MKNIIMLLQRAQRGGITNAKIEENVPKVESDKNVNIFKNKETDKEDMKKHRCNINEILNCSNATPIRCHRGKGYACCFCSEQYQDAADLKKHTLECHDEVVKGKYVQKVMLDITGLKCNICGDNIDTLELLISHLKIVHQRNVFTDIKNQILPFKFNSDSLRCCICLNEYNNFKVLLEHMNIHYRNFICDVCDAGFPTQLKLYFHIQIHKLGTFTCDHCTKVFDTHRKKRLHERGVHIYSNYTKKCWYCNEKFKNETNKLRHMATVHGIESPGVKCRACDKTFANQQALRVHTRKEHLMERPHECKLCEMKFYSHADLRNHTVKHTGLREFKCEVCFKSYGRQKTLKEHMRIHANDRRFKCEHCGQAFVQKCSWRGHMRSKHDEMV